MKISWGTALIIFFSIFFTLAVIFIVFSFSQQNDLVTDDYYEQGANYSNTIDEKKRSFDYKDSIQVSSFDRYVLLVFAQSILTNSDSCVVHFYCNSNRDYDYFLKVKNLTDSVFIDKKKLSDMHYTCNISWWSKSIKYSISQNITIK